MKKVLVVLAFLGLAVSLAFALYAINMARDSDNQPSPQPTSSPLINKDETENIKVEIKEALIKKHGEDAGMLDISVAEVSGNYAKGGASKEGLGGGMWFAAKVNDKWELVWDGNGIITCEDLNDYPEFPSSMIPQCYDTDSEEIVDR